MSVIALLADTRRRTLETIGEGIATEKADSVAKIVVCCAAGAVCAVEAGDAHGSGLAARNALVNIMIECVI